MNNNSIVNSKENTTVAILVHIGGLFTSWVVPLIVFLINKSDSEKIFTTDNAREALNFQISVFIAYVLCFILSFVLIGLFMFWIVMMANLVLSIVAAVKASNGSTYRYPMTIRLIK